MKFGKLLRITSSELGEVACILDCYKHSKKALKHLDADNDAEFVQTVCDYLRRFNIKSEERVLAIKSRYSHLQQQVATASGHDALVASHSLVLELHGEVLLMLHWSMLAYTGLCKILKKYHKRTGRLLNAPGMEDVLQYPFCSTEALSHLQAQVYAMLEHLNGELGLPQGEAPHVQHQANSAVLDDGTVRAAAGSTAAPEPPGSAPVHPTSSQGLPLQTQPGRLEQHAPSLSGDARRGEAQPPCCAPHAASAGEGHDVAACTAGVPTQLPHEAVCEAAALQCHGTEADRSPANGRAAAAAAAQPQSCSNSAAPARAGVHMPAAHKRLFSELAAAALPEEEHAAKARCTQACHNAAQSNVKPCHVQRAPKPDVCSADAACASGRAGSTHSSGSHEADDDAMWQKLCGRPAGMPNAACGSRLLAQTQVALNTWQHLGHSSTPGPHACTAQAAPQHGPAASSAAPCSRVSMTGGVAGSSSCSH